MTIYYVEDEKQLADLLTKYLERENYSVKTFYTGEEAIKHIKDKNVSLWILDITLPGKIDGFHLINKIKEQDENMPVLFTSARNEDIDKVYGLEIGSDDYLGKPFSPREFVLRVNNLLKRSKIKKEEIVQYRNYDINLTRRIVLNGSEEIKLTHREFNLLEYLLKKEQAVKREELLEYIWGDKDKQNSRIVDDLLRRLRNKMPDLKVETIYGLGYKIS